MTKKHKFIAEYEIKASPKMLFPYLNSATGLSLWFADDVNITPDKIFIFIWDGDTHKARLTSQRINVYSKFEFIPKADDTDPEVSYIEFKLDTNELTQSTFLKVVDFTDVTDVEELKDLWDHLIVNLKVIVGG